MEQNTFHATIVWGGSDARSRKGAEIARKLICSDREHAPCGVCRDCRKAIQGIHPDIISVEQFREKSDTTLISVGMMRQLRTDAFIKPNEAARKVYMIPDAQNMNIQGQNSMLKLLEEGPEYAAFILMCDAPGSLLETIISRCIQVNAGVDEEDQVSDQALAFASILADGNELDRVEWLVRLEKEKPNKAAMSTLLRELESLCNDAVVGSVKKQFRCDESRRLSERMAVRQLLSLAEVFRKGQEMAEFNVSAGHLLGWIGTQM